MGVEKEEPWGRQEDLKGGREGRLAAASSLSLEAVQVQLATLAVSSKKCGCCVLLATQTGHGAGLSLHLRSLIVLCGQIVGVLPSCPGRGGLEPAGGGAIVKDPVVPRRCPAVEVGPAKISVV